MLPTLSAAAVIGLISMGLTGAHVLFDTSLLTTFLRRAFDADLPLVMTPLATLVLLGAVKRHSRVRRTLAA